MIVGCVDSVNLTGHPGWAFLYLGSAEGPTPEPNWSVESPNYEQYFGVAATGAGDVDGDGFDDVLIGAYQYHQYILSDGRVYVFAGSPDGLSVEADWVVLTEQEYGAFGSAAASAGDVDGDGYPDVIVGDEDFAADAGVGKVYLFRGGAAGLETEASWTAVSDGEGVYFGEAVASAGDVNGDGFDDVAVGDGNYGWSDGSGGQVVVFLGSAAGLEPEAAWTVQAWGDLDSLGSSVASAGDVNADGFSDLVVGAYGTPSPAEYAGAAVLFLGSATGLAAEPAWSDRGASERTFFGHSVGSAGDIDGDGADEVVVGRDYWTGDVESQGKAWLYRAWDDIGDDTGAGKVDEAEAPCGCATSPAPSLVFLLAVRRRSHRGSFGTRKK